MKPAAHYIEEIDGCRILYGNDTEIDLENDIVLEEINGAYIKDDSLRVDIIRNEWLTNVDGYDVGDWTLIFREGYKLGDLLDRVPFGIIDKSITGIDATTLEMITDVRSSIIVVPTKALAYNKHQSINALKDENYSMYIGSSIGIYTRDVTLKDIQNYLELRGTGIKKFIVVADSLPMLLNYLTELGEQVYSDYFLMIDEIDTMQSDSAYRPRLEVVMDYYFRFKFYNRCAISATLREFSNPKLSQEARLRIEWDVQPKRAINTLYTSYVDDLAWNEINFHLESNEDKILVAYNSLDGIFNIIKHLSIPSTECGILCSERSMSKAKEYIDDADISIDNHGHLLKRVTFMTCAYFAGIDILDRCHLIIISSRLQPFTYLSLNRIAQIAGRCRDGNISETIIYDIAEHSMEVHFSSSSQYVQSMMERAVKYAAFLNNMTKTTSSYSELKPLQDFIYSYMDFVGKKKPTPESYPLSIVRQDSITSEFVPAFFNIDALREMWELRNSLYRNKYEIVKSLQADGHSVTSLPDALLPAEEHDDSDIKAIKLHNKEILAQSFESLKQQLIDWVNSGCNIFQLKEIKRNTNKRLQDTVIAGFELLSPYLPTLELLDKLGDVYNHERKFRNFINSAIFHALPINHPFKATLLMSYGVDINTGSSKLRFTYNESQQIIREVFKSVLHYEPHLSPIVISDLNKSFFSWARSKKGDRINGINPYGLSPVDKYMPIDAKILDIIRLPR